MSRNVAPICLFTYNRLAETKQTVEALKNNFMAAESELFVFSDGAKNKETASKVAEVRNYLKTLSGFKNIEIVFSEDNKGLANSIIHGVSQVMSKYGKVIVLEDDLVTSPNFLDFMNQALEFYKDHQKVFSISGYTMNLPSLKKDKNDYYVGYRASSWGWASWSKSWVDVDWEIKDYKDFSKSKTSNRIFKRGGSDMLRMLKNQRNSKIDSWAITWCYHQFKKDQLTVFPTISKIVNIGFGKDATHTKFTFRFETDLD